MKKIFIHDENKTREIIAEKIKTIAWLQPVADRMFEICDEMLTNPDDWLDNPVGYTARQIGGKIGALYTAWLLTGQQNYLEQAIVMFDQATERNLAYYRGINGHLAVGDAVLAITILYNFLFDHISREQRERAEALLTELANFLDTSDCIWGLPQKSVTSCNHNSVHYGALGICGMVMENEKWLAHGLDRMKAFLRESLDATGYCPEGLSYMNFGNLTAILFCEAYKERYGVQLYDKPLAINQMIAHMLPVPGHVLRVNDHGESVENMLPQVYLATRYRNPGALYLITEYEQAIGENFSDWKLQMKSGFVYPFIYMVASKEVLPEKPSVCGTPKTQMFETGRNMTRTAWDDPMAYFVSVSCGECYHGGHNHADKGDFTIYGNGEEFLVDVGSKSNEDRSHNILMVNGIGQPKGISRGEIRDAWDREEAMFVSCDTTGSYKYTPDSLVGMGLRNVLFLKKPFPMLIIRDDMQLERPMEELQKYEFMMHTKLGNQFRVDDRAIEIIGQNYGNRCRLQFVYPDKVDVQISHEDRINISYRKPVHVNSLSEEAIATCYAYDPFLTTVITFADKDGEYPEIQADGDPMNMIIKANFQGDEKLVNISRMTMTILK